MWTENARPTLHDYRINWQITIVHAINPVDGVPSKLEDKKGEEGRTEENDTEEIDCFVKL